MRKLLYTLPVLFSLFIFKGCDLLSGVPDKDLINKIDNQVEWEKAEKLTVTVAFPYDWGTSRHEGVNKVGSIFNGQVTIGDVRKGYPFEVEFYPNPNYALIEWRVYKSADLEDVRVAGWIDNPTLGLAYLDMPWLERVDITQPAVDEYGNGSTVDGMYSITINIDEPVTVVPVCRSQPRIIRSNPNKSTVTRSRTAEINIQFSGNLQADTYDFDPNEVYIFGVNEEDPTRNFNSGTDVFEAPVFNPDTKQLIITPSRVPPDTNITLRLRPGIKNAIGGSLPDSDLYEFTWKTMQGLVGIDDWQAEYVEGEGIKVRVTYKVEPGASSELILLYNNSYEAPPVPISTLPNTHQSIWGSNVVYKAAASEDYDINTNTTVVELTIPVAATGRFDGSWGSAKGFNIQIILFTQNEYLLFEDDDKSLFQMWNIPGMGRIYHTNPIVRIANIADFGIMNADTAGKVYVFDNVSGETGTRGVNGWNPVGDANPFAGRFYGLGKTINISAPAVDIEGSVYGLFGNISGAQIHNININYTGTHNLKNVTSFGGIAANSQENVTLSNVNVGHGSGAGDIKNTHEDNSDVYMGGFIGNAVGNVTVTNSGANLNMSVHKTGGGEVNVGGWFGKSTAVLNLGTNLKTVSPKITVSSNGTDEHYIGGVAGYIIGGSLDNFSYTANFVTDSAGYNIIGGIAGRALNSGITNASVTFNSATAYNAVLFGGIAGLAENGTVSDSTVTYSGNVSLTSDTGANWGGAVGFADGTAAISKIIVTGTGTLGTSGSSAAEEIYLGGVAGSLGASGTPRIEESYSTVNINAEKSGTGDIYAGGLAGYSTGNISKSWASGTVKGKRTAGSDDLGIGGLAGYSSGSITDCYATGSVEIDDAGSDRPAGGGLAGILEGSISHSFAKGDVKVISSKSSGGVYAGGLVGWNSPGSSVSYSAAIGEKVIASGGDTPAFYRIGRTDLTTGTYTKNYARANMGIGSNITAVPDASSTGPNTANGQSVLVSSLKNSSFWTRTDLINFNASATWDINNLSVGHPRLISAGLSVQPVTPEMVEVGKTVTITEVSAGVKGPYGTLQLHKRDPLDADIEANWKPFASGSDEIEQGMPVRATVTYDNNETGYSLNALTADTVIFLQTAYASPAERIFDMPGDTVTITATFTADPQPAERLELSNGDIEIINNVNSEKLGRGNGNGSTLAPTDSTVDVIVYADDGYEIKSIFVTGKKDNSVIFEKTYDSGDGKSTETCTFQMPVGGVNVDATFLAVPQPLNVNITGKGKVTVTYDDDGTSVSPETATSISPLAKIRTDKAVSITAEADPGYTVTSISATGTTLDGTALGTTATRTFDMPADEVTLDVVFEAVLQTITLTPPSPSKGSYKVGTTDSGSANVTMESPTDSTLTVATTPPAGYSLGTVTITKSGVTPIQDVTSEVLNIYTLTVPPYPITVSVTFTADPKYVLLKKPAVGSYTVGTTAIYSTSTSDIPLSNIKTDDTFTISVDTVNGYRPGVVTVKRYLNPYTDVTSTYYDTTTKVLTVPPFDATVEVTYERKQVHFYTYVNGSVDYVGTNKAAGAGGEYTVTVGAANLVKGTGTTSDLIGNPYDTGSVVSLSIEPADGYYIPAIITTSMTGVDTDAVGKTNPYYLYREKNVDNTDNVDVILPFGSTTLDPTGSVVTRTFIIPDTAVDNTASDIKVWFEQKVYTVVKGEENNVIYSLDTIQTHYDSPINISIQSFTSGYEFDEITAVTSNGDNALKDITIIDPNNTYEITLDDLDHGETVTVTVKYRLNEYDITTCAPSGADSYTVNVTNAPGGEGTEKSVKVTSSGEKISANSTQLISIVTEEAGYRVSSIYGVYVVVFSPTYISNNPFSMPAYNVTLTNVTLQKIPYKLDIGTATDIELSEDTDVVLGDTITVTATSADGDRLASVIVNGNSDSTGITRITNELNKYTYTFTFGEEHIPASGTTVSVSATFETKKIQVYGGSNLSVSTDISQPLNVGTAVSFNLTSTLPAGYLEERSISYTSAGDPKKTTLSAGATSFVIPQDADYGSPLTVNRTFTPKTYTVAGSGFVTFGASDVGTFTVPTALNGASVNTTITITHNIPESSGYEFNAMTVTTDDSNYLTVSTTGNTFVLPDLIEGAKITIAITAKKRNINISLSGAPSGGTFTVKAGSNAAVTLDGTTTSTTAQFEEIVIITAVPDTANGYRINSFSLSGGVTQTGLTDTYQIDSMPATAVTINVTNAFTNSYNISVPAGYMVTTQGTPPSTTALSTGTYGTQYYIKVSPGGGTINTENSVKVINTSTATEVTVTAPSGSGNTNYHGFTMPASNVSIQVVTPFTLTNNSVVPEQGSFRVTYGNQTEIPKANPSATPAIPAGTARILPGDKFVVYIDYIPVIETVTQKVNIVTTPSVDPVVTGTADNPIYTYTMPESNVSVTVTFIAPTLAPLPSIISNAFNILAPEWVSNAFNPIPQSSSRNRTSPYARTGNNEQGTMNNEQGTINSEQRAVSRQYDILAQKILERGTPQEIFELHDISEASVVNEMPSNILLIPYAKSTAVNSNVEEETAHGLHELNELHELDNVNANSLPRAMALITIALYLCLANAMLITGIRKRK